MPTLNWIGKDKGLEVHEALQKANESDSKLGVVPIDVALTRTYSTVW